MKATATILTAAILIMRSAAVSKTSRSAWANTDPLELREMLRVVEGDTAALRGKMRIAVLTVLAALVPLLASCASERGDINRASAKAAATSREVSLTNATGNLLLHTPADTIGPIRLEVFGDTLIGGSFRPATAGGVPWLRVGDVSVPVLSAAQPAPAGALRSNDWQYLRIDGEPRTSSGVLKSARRHLLLVEPDIVVVLDELALTNSDAVEIHIPLLNPLQHDSVRDEWTLNSGRAGMVVRLLALPKATQSWHASVATTASRSPADAAAGWLRSAVAESGPEFHHLAIFAVHANQARRSLAFKLLESDTAIGARIHRDGLPTLVAFRKQCCTGEANLTGLKFTAPVAVDVFRPKRRK